MTGKSGGPMTVANPAQTGPMTVAGDNLDLAKHVILSALSRSHEQFLPAVDIQPSRSRPPLSCAGASTRTASKRRPPGLCPPARSIVL
jgi:hypothetical protein